MADPSHVNSQITDAVSECLLQATSQSLALAAHNATSNQQHLNILANAVTSTCVALIQGGTDAATAKNLLALLREGSSPTPPGRRKRASKKSTAKRRANKKVARK